MKFLIRHIAAAAASFAAAAAFSMPAAAAANTAEKCGDKHWSAVASGECLNAIGLNGSQANDRAASTKLAVAVDVPAAPVPEPETYALMLAGLAVVALVASRRKHRG
jgi:PEP-CTERM motif